MQIQRYVNKISGPLLDRIDIHIEVPAVKFKELETADVDSSNCIRSRVIAARNRQIERFSSNSIFANAQMNSQLIAKHCKISNNAKTILEHALNRLGLSARAYDRILKVSRTIADIEGASNIDTHHIAEAIQYRSLDRNYWK